MKKKDERQDLRMKIKIAPSLTYADIMDLKSTLSAFELNGVDLLHIDVTDGYFTPGIISGAPLCDALHAHTAIPLDLHFAVEQPEKILPCFNLKKGDQVAIYAESTSNLYRTISAVKKAGAKAFLALTLTTPLSVLEEALDYIDGVLLVLSEPGSSNTKIPSGAISKIERTKALLTAKGHASMELEVQGFMSFENAAKMKKAGANIFVGDNLSVFHKDQTLAGGIVRLRNAVQS